MVERVRGSGQTDVSSLLLRNALSQQPILQPAQTLGRLANAFVARRMMDAQQQESLDRTRRLSEALRGSVETSDIGQQDKDALLAFINEDTAELAARPILSRFLAPDSETEQQFRINSEEAEITLNPEQAEQFGVEAGQAFTGQVFFPGTGQPFIQRGEQRIVLDSDQFKRKEKEPAPRAPTTQGVIAPILAKIARGEDVTPDEFDALEISQRLNPMNQMIADSLGLGLPGIREEFEKRRNQRNNPGGNIPQAAPTSPDLEGLVKPDGTPVTENDVQLTMQNHDLPRAEVIRVLRQGQEQEQPAAAQTGTPAFDRATRDARRRGVAAPATRAAGASPLDLQTGTRF